MIVIALLLGAVYVYSFTDWFRAPAKVQILAMARPTNINGRPVKPNQVLPVTFAFNRKVRLTEVKVVAVDDEKTNRFPHALWQLISDSNSIPVKQLIYSVTVRGMKPKVPRGKAEPLEPDVPYRLYIKEANSVGQVDFKTKTSVPTE